MPLISFGQIADVEVFCQVAETGRFASAAERLGLPPSSVTRIIQRLETRLGVPLFQRTTRRVSLTADGAAYYAEVRQALAQIEDAELSLAGSGIRLIGRLKVAVPTTYGNICVLPLMPAFQAMHPGLTIEVDVTNRDINVIEEGFDLVVRLGAQPSSTLISKLIMNGTLGVFASPDYLATSPPIRDPSDLARHRCIGFVYPGVPRALEWEFLSNGRPVRIQAANHTLVVSDPNGLVTLALAGGGLIQTGHYVVADHLRSGRLVEVLADHGGITRQVVALYPANRQRSPKVRAFLDMLVQG